MPINELLPKDPQYEHSGDFSLLPLKQKIIPFAPGQGPLSPDIPGFARTMLNDLWLAFTGPGEALQGKYTQEEIERVGMRAGSALTWGAGPAAAAAGARLPENALTAGNWWGKWNGDKIAKEAEEHLAPKEKEFDDPALNELSNELKQLNSSAFQKFSKKGYVLNFLNGEYVVYPLHTGQFSKEVLPNELPFDLQLLHAKLNTKHQEFNKLKAGSKASAVAPEDKAADLLKNFESIFAEVNGNLGKLGYTVKGPSAYGDYGVADLATGKDVRVGPGNPAHVFIDDLNKAAQRYDDEIVKHELGQEPPPVAKFNQVYQDSQKAIKGVWNALEIEADPQTGVFHVVTPGGKVLKDYMKGGVIDEALKKLNKAKEGYTSEIQPTAGKKSPADSAEPVDLSEFKQKPYLSHEDDQFVKDTLAGAKTLEQAYTNAWGQFYDAGYHLDKKDDKLALHKLNSQGGIGGLVDPGLLPAKLEALFDATNSFGTKKQLPDPKSKPGAKSGTGAAAGYTPKPTQPGVFGKYYEKNLEELPEQKMREYTPKELDWEYNTEYGKYAKSEFPDAFASRQDFQAKYDGAPLRHLTQKELHGLGYSTVGGILKHQGTKEEKVQAVLDQIGSRRDVPAIMKAIEEGQTAPPIVLKHEGGLRLLGGNTRLLSAAALGKSLPVKVIDVRKFPLAGSSKFDPAPALPQEQSAANFKKWFGNSPVTDEVGNPKIFYHATNANEIEAFDPKIAEKKSNRPFISLTSDPKFASNWKDGGQPGDTHYPVFVNLKNPGDFRRADHVKKAGIWKTRQWYKNNKSMSEKEIDEYISFDPANKQTYDHYLAENLQKAKSGYWGFWEDPKMWKDLGFDGAYMNEYGNPAKDALNIAVPNPSSIKSVFNKGYWNPKDPRLLYAGGGAPVPLNLEPVNYNPFLLEEVPGDPFAEGAEK